MLQIDPPLLLVTLVLFLGLILVLNSILYKPLLKFIDSRNSSIKEDEDSVSKNASDVTQYASEIEKILQDARAEANSIKQSAISSAKDEALKIIAAKKEALDVEYSVFSSKLTSRKDELKKSLLEQIPSFKQSLNSSLSKL